MAKEDARAPKTSILHEISHSRLGVRRSRRHRHVHFQKDLRKLNTVFHVSRPTTVRTLFCQRSLLELPDEVLVHVFSYFDAASLAKLQMVCHKFKDLVEDNLSLWSSASYQNLWPAGIQDTGIFARGAHAGNPECLIKLGLACLYHYNLKSGISKTKKLTAQKATMAAAFFRDLDNRLAPKKPLTWTLIRPPWASTYKSICLKQAIYNKLEHYSGPANGALHYNLGQIMKFADSIPGNDAMATENFTRSAEESFSHAQFELLMSRRVDGACTDPGLQLKWMREMHECASCGNQDAAFELCRQFASGNLGGMRSDQAVQVSRNVFWKCSATRIDKLDHQLQPKVNSLMRCILVDWLAEVAYMKDMSNKVLQAAVRLVDSYLSLRVIDRTKLQLLGITCLLLAAKTQIDSRQVHILTVRESSWLTDQTYTYEDVVKMMGEVIGALNGDLWKPTSCDYLELLFMFSKADSRCQALAHFINDMSIQYSAFGLYKPSVHAASVLMLAHIVDKADKVWSSCLAEWSGFEVKDLVNCVGLLYHKCFVSPPCNDDRDLPLKTIKEQYSSEKMHRVAVVKMPTEEEVKAAILASSSGLLTCAGREPLQFHVVQHDVEDTLNISVRSVDYDGDNEDCTDFLNSSSSGFEDESFSVGRSRYPSVLSTDGFDSHDETTMELESFQLDVQPLRGDKHGRENFTPILQNGKCGFIFAKHDVVEEESFRECVTGADHISPASDDETGACVEGVTLERTGGKRMRHGFLDKAVPKRPCMRTRLGCKTFRK